jgi:hypothetical protein
MSLASINFYTMIQPLTESREARKEIVRKALWSPHPTVGLQLSISLNLWSKYSTKRRVSLLPERKREEARGHFLRRLRAVIFG